MNADDTAVFVYGTLRPGQPNYRVVSSGVATQVSAHGHGLRLYAASHRGYPYASLGAAHEAVVGSLLLLRPARVHEVLRRLDHLEGFDPDHPDQGHYLRRRHTVVTDEASRMGPPGSRIDAWVYLAGPRTPLACLHPIPSGDWMHPTTATERTDACVAYSV